VSQGPGRKVVVAVRMEGRDKGVGVRAIYELLGGSPEEVGFLSVDVIPSFTAR